MVEAQGSMAAENGVIGRGITAGFRGPAGRATIVLVLLRITYAYNWFDVGPGFPAISGTFGLSPSAWGILLAAFLVGAGLLQVPSGFLARRYGARVVALSGAALLGVAALASAGAPSFLALVGLRLAAGAGAGLFFSPAIALVASLHPEGSRGIPVGTFSSAFSAGAALGIFASALAIPEVGWRGSLAIGGVLLLVLTAVGFLGVPRWAGRAPPRIPGRTWAVPAVLRSRAVWGVGVAFVGLEGASMSAGQYFVPYAESIRSWAPALAGAVGAVFVFPSLFGGPIGGRLAERFQNRRTQLALVTGVPAIPMFLLPFAGLAPTLVIAATFSVGGGMAYAMMYILPHYLPGLAQDDVPLAIGLLNGIQLGGGASIALLIGWVIDRAGYTVAWQVLAVLIVVPLGFLALVPRTSGSGIAVPIPSSGPSRFP
jgi:MFS family permease